MLDSTLSEDNKLFRNRGFGVKTSNVCHIYNMRCYFRIISERIH